MPGNGQFGGGWEFLGGRFGEWRWVLVNGREQTELEGAPGLAGAPGRRRSRLGAGGRMCDGAGVQPPVSRLSRNDPSSTVCGANLHAAFQRSNVFGIQGSTTGLT